jgi:splicing factor 45
LLEFCSRDATVRITYTYSRGHKERIVASAYLPYDSDEPQPTNEVRDITEYCHSRKKQLIIGCDANAHHTLWGEHRHQSKRRKPHRISGEFNPEYS